jgi:hypothetical protein
MKLIRSGLNGKFDNNFHSCRSVRDSPIHVKTIRHVETKFLRFK